MQVLKVVAGLELLLMPLVRRYYCSSELMPTVNAFISQAAGSNVWQEMNICTGILFTVYNEPASSHMNAVYLESNKCLRLNTNAHRPFLSLRRNKKGAQQVKQAKGKDICY